VEDLDEETGSAEVSLQHSIFVEHAEQGGERRSCGFFSSWIAGSMDWAAEASAKKWRVQCYEQQCVMAGFDKCRFRAESHK
jgi:hypothetical protein